MTAPSAHDNHPADPWSDLLTSGFAEWSKLLGTSRDAAAPPDGQPLAAPAVEPEKGDRRFADRAWESNAIFAMLKQTYLLTTASLLKSAAEVQGLDRRQQRRLAFYVRQFADTLSPANFPLTNPA